MKKTLVLFSLFFSSVVLSACSTPAAIDTPASSTALETGETKDLELKSQDLLKEQTMSVKSDFEPTKVSQAVMKTSKGDVTIELYPEKTPVTVANFVSLAKSGFYNGIKFHRIIEDFMAQVGDPLTKDASKQAMWGSGGPGYTIPDEFVADLKHDSEGVLSMANTGQPSTGGSQFFITHEATPWLDGKHAVFGKVTSGMDVVRSLVIGDEIISITLSE